jgi:hypothetical protein
MESLPQESLRSHARAVVVIFAATVALGIVLLLAFEPDVQTIDADELVDRSGDARAFLIADFVFIVLYAVLSPLAIRRFGEALGAGRSPAWIRVGALALLGAGLFDAIENTLLLIATDSASQGTVDAAHAVAVPKIALFAAGALLAILAVARAIRVLLAEGPSSGSPARGGG